MKVVRQQRHKKWAAEILQSELSPLDKTRKLVALGYDEEEADKMVNGIQIGLNQPVYYEQLPNPEYTPDE